MPLFTAVHKVQRLSFARNHAHRIIDDWRSLFTEVTGTFDFYRVVVIKSGEDVVNFIAHATSHQGSRSELAPKCSGVVFVSMSVLSSSSFTGGN